MVSSLNKFSGLWCLMQLSTIFHYIVDVYFIGGVNRSTWKKPSNYFASHRQTCIEYTSQWAGFELRTLVVIGTNCTGSCKSNYHTITITTASYKSSYNLHLLHFLYTCTWCNIIKLHWPDVEFQTLNKYISELQWWYICVRKLYFS